MGIATLNRTVNRLNVAVNGLGGQSLAAFVRGLGPAAWFRYGVGITSAGGLVSAWADQSGNGRDLLQATDTNKPTLEADGSITFDGVDNVLKCASFTLEQPETVYFLGKQVTWTIGDFLLDGDSSTTGAIPQTPTTPRLRINAGADAATNADLAVDTYGVVVAVFNGASSLLQVNNGTPATGDPGAGDMGGFTLGANGSGAADFSNINAKEVILYASAHDAVTRRRVIRYLSQVGQLGL